MGFHPTLTFLRRAALLAALGPVAGVRAQAQERGVLMIELPVPAHLAGKLKLVQGIYDQPFVANVNIRRKQGEKVQDLAPPLKGTIVAEGGGFVMRTAPFLVRPQKDKDDFSVSDAVEVNCTIIGVIERVNHRDYVGSFTGILTDPSGWGLATFQNLVMDKGALLFPKSPTVENSYLPRVLDYKELGMTEKDLESAGSGDSKGRAGAVETKAASGVGAGAGAGAGAGGSKPPSSGAAGETKKSH